MPALSAAFELPLPRTDAFALFTARGEKRWVEGWHPEFFTEAFDDTAVGTVFRTRDDSGRATTWIVVDSVADASIRYARVQEDGTAGTVAVSLAGTDEGCRVTVSYDLTATDDASRADLARFDSGYAEYIESWRHAIHRHVIDGEPLAARHPVP
jgi:hypothetical protein